MLVLLLACSSPPASRPAPAPEPPPGQTIDNVRRLNRKPPKADREPTRKAWEPLFPGRQVAICGRPIVIGEGIYQAGDALVLVDERTTQVIYESEGTADATLLDASWGTIEWKEQTCRWAGQKLVKATGRVEGGGVHTIVGCPGGSRRSTEADGTFKIQIGSGRSCEARVLDATGLALGAVAKLEEGAKELVVQPATTPVSEDALAEALAARQKLLQARLDRLSAEQSRMGGLEVKGSQADWYREQLKAQVDDLRLALDRLGTPAGKAEALASVHDD